jgi:hypothetical protein
VIKEGNKWKDSCRGGRYFFPPRELNIAYPKMSRSDNGIFFDYFMAYPSPSRKMPVTYYIMKYITTTALFHIHRKSLIGTKFQFTIVMVQVHTKNLYSLCSLFFLSFSFFLSFFWCNTPPPPVGQDLQILEVCRLHTTTQHSR